MNIRFHIDLSEQDLAEFLNDDKAAMEQYRYTLERRLQEYGTARVEIVKSLLNDNIVVNTDEDREIVCGVMENLLWWDWLEVLDN